MKKIFISGVVLLAALFVKAQVNDPILMHVGNEAVTRSEFEYSFNKNNAIEGSTEQMSLDEYVQRFINYKLKVIAAKDAKLDTLSSFIKEFRTYRDMQLLPSLVDTVYIDSIARAVYDNVKTNLNESDLIHPAHIFLRLPQNASEAVKQQKKQRIDSLYTALQSGANFEELAKKYSEDFGSAKNGGLLPWIGPNSTLKEFEEQAYTLQTNQMSKPFLSTAGYHIILMKERKALEPYEEKKAEIVEFLNQQHINEQASERGVQKMIKQSNNTLTCEDIMQRVQAELVAKTPSLKYLIKEYYDGLLLYEISNRLVWQKATTDEDGLDAYYRAHKSKYKWDSPRFKGIVFRCKDEKEISAIAKFLKKADEVHWKAEMDSMFNHRGQRQVVAEKGIYKKGENTLVDALIFGVPESKKSTILPYSGYAGKTLSKPKSYKDVRADVVSDYQDEMEAAWVKELRNKYATSVDEAVLKTVNKHE